MFRDFRSVLVVTVLIAATLPALLIALPLVRTISGLVAENATRELDLRASALARDTQHEIETLLIRMNALSRDSDMRNATKSVLFEASAEALMSRAVRESPLVTSITLYDDRAREVLRVPASSRRLDPARLGNLPAVGTHRIESEDDGLRLTMAVDGLLGRSSGALVATLPFGRLQERLNSRTPAPARVDFSLAEPPATPADIVRATATVDVDGGNAPVHLHLSVSELRAQRFAVVRGARARLLWATLAALLLLMATSFAVARRIARPLERLAQLESELHLLKQQMHPHFLFNILNNVGAMIPLEPERATEMIAKLSELYRRILSSSKISTSRLASELAVVRDFLDLQKMRFGDRLHYAIAAPEHALSLHVPSLLVQTLVENAVKHGVEKSREGGDIRVSIDGDGKNWICEISNSGAPFREDARQGDGGGTGLENTRKRLKLLYGKVGTFEIGRAPDGRTVARFGFTGEEK